MTVLYRLILIYWDSALSTPTRMWRKPRKERQYTLHNGTSQFHQCHGQLIANTIYKWRIKYYCLNLLRCLECNTAQSISMQHNVDKGARWWWKCLLLAHFRQEGLIIYIIDLVNCLFGYQQKRSSSQQLMSGPVPPQCQHSPQHAICETSENLSFSF